MLRIRNLNSVVGFLSLYIVQIKKGENNRMKTMASFFNAKLLMKFRFHLSSELTIEKRKLHNCRMKFPSEHNKIK